MANTMPFFHLNDDNKRQCLLFGYYFSISNSIQKKQSIDKGGRISGKKYERVLIDYH